MACLNGHCTNQGCDNCTTKNTAPCPGNNTTWTDTPVSTVINVKAVHVNQIRNALDAERARRAQANCGIGWAAKNVGDSIVASNFTDLKSCNNGLDYYPGDGDALTTVADTYSIGALILASHVNTLRSALNQNEVRCRCNTDCGPNDCFCSCFGDCGACNYP